VGLTRIFIARDVDAYAKKQRWADELFVNVVRDIERGLDDGALGAGIYKRRVARDGAGSSAGHRVVVVMKMGSNAFIVEAFAKNVKASHTPDELRTLKELAKALLKLAEEPLRLGLASGTLREIKQKHDDK
jgi:hypothetical protein